MIDKNVIEANKAAIFECMQKCGIVSAVVTYEGSGDEGDIQDVSVTPSFEIDRIMVDQQRVYSRGDDGIETTQVDLQTALQDLCNDLVELHGHEGYENEEGGRGELTLRAASRSYVLDHADFVVNEEHSSYEG